MQIGRWWGVGTSEPGDMQVPDRCVAVLSAAQW